MSETATSSNTGNIITTGSFTLPTQFADSIFKKTQTTSVLARLSGSEAQKFGNVNVMTLTAAPKAELVGEGVSKSPTPATFSNKVVRPYKLQVTVRCSDEVKWADEDYQLGVLRELTNQCGIALGRALDIIGIHKVNPLSGSVATQVTEGIVDTTSIATIASGKYDEAVEAAAGKVIAAGYSPSGIAFDPNLAFNLATQRDADGRRLYPELGLGQNATAFMGLTAAVGDTVSGKKEVTTASKIEGIVGDFDAFRYGVQRDIKAHMIEFGDPDGLGDLQRQNQVAIRAEIVYGVGIMDNSAFALVKTA